MFSRTIPKPARWEYMGEYESELAGQLSPSAFKQQTQAVREIDIISSFMLTLMV